MYIIILVLKHEMLTVDSEIKRLADFTADGIGHFARERPLVVAGYVEDGQGGVSGANLNPVAHSDHRAAIHPKEGRGGALG